MQPAPKAAGVRSVMAWRRRIPGYAALSWLRQMLLDPQFRETARLRAFRPLGLLQPSGHTRPDRHPELFALAREQVGDGPDHHLLSFGCATGDEVFSLRHYFPQARITGIDISAARIRRCRGRARRAGADASIAFAVGASASDMPEDAFDAVFAMSVLRHGDLSGAPPACDHVLLFADFERVVSGLARCVRPGGVLILRHAAFRFVDTAAARNFAPLLRLPRKAQGPLYDTDNRLLPLEDEETVAFRKI